MDYLDDDEFDARPTPSRPSPITIVGLLAAAGAAVLLLWMNLGLSSRVSILEEGISSLQKSASEQNQPKEIADISNQLDSVTQALANHLKSQAKSRGTQGSLAMRPATPASVLSSRAIPSRALPFRNLPIQPIPGRSAPVSSYQPPSGGSLPPPISSPSYAPVQNRVSSGWVVNITSVSDSESAYQEVARLQSMGMNAESSRAISNGRVWYRIRIPGFSSHDEASAARPSLEARLGIRDTWVGRRE